MSGYIQLAEQYKIYRRDNVSQVKYFRKKSFRFPLFDFTYSKRVVVRSRRWEYESEGSANSLLIALWKVNKNATFDAWLMVIISLI